MDPNTQEVDAGDLMGFCGLDFGDFFKDSFKGVKRLMRKALRRKNKYAKKKDSADKEEALNASHTPRASDGADSDTFAQDLASGSSTGTSPSTDTATPSPAVPPSPAALPPPSRTLPNAHHRRASKQLDKSVKPKPVAAVVKFQIVERVSPHLAWSPLSLLIPLLVFSAVLALLPWEASMPPPIAVKPEQSEPVTILFPPPPPPRPSTIVKITLCGNTAPVSSFWQEYDSATTEVVYSLPTEDHCPSQCLAATESFAVAQQNPTALVNQDHPWFTCKNTFKSLPTCKAPPKGYLEFSCKSSLWESMDYSWPGCRHANWRQNEPQGGLLVYQRDSLTSQCFIGDQTQMSLQGQCSWGNTGATTGTNALLTALNGVAILLGLSVVVMLLPAHNVLLLPQSC